VNLTNPICNVWPMSLSDIVCIDETAIPLRQLAKPEFKDLLDSFEASIAAGLRQLDIYVKIKPDLALKAVRQHNRSVLDMRQEMLDEEMITSIRVCKHCTKLFSSNEHNFNYCYECGEDL